MGGAHNANYAPCGFGAAQSSVLGCDGNEFQRAKAGVRLLDRNLSDYSLLIELSSVLCWMFGIGNSHLINGVIRNEQHVSFPVDVGAYIVANAHPLDRINRMHLPVTCFHGEGNKWHRA
jgi:hypothetical protein